MTEETESPVVWYAKTIGYVILTALVTVILANAVQSFFLEKITRIYSTAAAGAAGATVAGLRRKRLAIKPKSESNQ